MDIFMQKKLLMRIVILLAVLNLFLIGAFLWKDFFHKPPPPPNISNDFRDVSAILLKELNLSGRQFEQIKNLRSEFFEKEEALAKEIRSERDSINAAMFNKNTNEELVKSIARRVADNDYKMELLRFDQAQELKSICTPEQLQKFERLVLEIRDYFRQDNKPPKN
jgi:Spy/CpxP family protein refolding chaperone